MSGWRNSSLGYGRTARMFHWVIAALVLMLIATGVIADELPRGPARGLLYDIHRGLGLIAAPLILVRLAWRGVDAPPAPAPWLTPTEKKLSQGVHLGLLAALLIQPTTGYLMYALEGETVGGLGLSVPPLPVLSPAAAGAARLIHETTAIALYLLVALHIGAVGVHTFARGDGTLARMTGAWARAVASPAKHRRSR